MRTTKIPKSLGTLLVGVLTVPALAAPALLVTKPPVQPLTALTGPSIDPTATAGQWFSDALTGAQQSRPYEFYDNAYLHGGSQTKGTRAIEGYVTALNFDGLGNMTGFNIFARITNDMPGVGQWQEMPNSHGEWRETTTPYYGAMRGVKLTASFADDGVLGNFPSSGAPYSGNELSQNIYGIGYDQLAWYCFTDTGGYMVPTWDFPDIEPGATVTRNLSFGLYNPVGPASSLYQFLLNAEQQQPDVFFNRTTSLKISNYFDALAIDDGTPYPMTAGLGSDVSVFFPEPTTLSLVALAGLVFLRRR